MPDFSRTSTNTTPTQLDIAIIGAGVSGLYSGWRLKNDIATEHLSSAIFEMSARIGGRLHSIKMREADNVAAELGGMRFMEHQKLVKYVIDTFGIQVSNFPMGSDDTNINYLRRQRFTDADWRKHGFEHRYFLDENNKHKSPDDLFQQLVDSIMAMPANQQILAEEGIDFTPGGTLNREEWDQIKHRLVDDNPNSPDFTHRLENIGFWNLIRSQLSSEAFELLADGGGYYSNTLNWNAAEALPYIVGDFSASVEYKTLALGFDQIARQLFLHYHDTGSVDGESQVHTETQLIGISYSGDANYKYTLTFKRLATDEVVEIKAAKVILALPRRSLALIADNINLGGDAEKAAFKENISTVIGEASFKLLMTFERAWWRDISPQNNGATIKFGHATTDMAMRQCYYFDTQDGHTESHAVMLASYNDMRTVSFWKPLEKDGHDACKLNNTLRFRPQWAKDDVQLAPRTTGPLSPYDEYAQAPERMVQHALQQLRELHDYPVPAPIDTAYMNWGDDPFGGGYHAWKANVSVGDHMALMRNAPFPGERLHVCGEAYSDQQGWVEGAFCIAELMLNDNFEVSPLPVKDDEGNDYYLGR